MRVTNPMITSKMMLNINRNMRGVDKLYNQIATTKKIQFPSDDPIIASRALKFRANVAETKQYQRNTAQGLSWMEITENAYNNVNEITTKIRELCVSGANDSLEAADRQKIADDINQLVEQLGTEMNVTYAGRYVFSGLRTDQPPVIETDNADSYKIAQYFKASDIAVTKSYQKFDEMNECKTYDVNIIKLAYQGMGTPTVSIVDGSGNPLVPSVPINIVSKDDPDAYIPTAGVAYNYIAETGELVIADSDYAYFANLPSGTEMKVEYTKNGFKKGELNPQVYFECTHTNGTPPRSYDMKNQNLEYEFSVNTRININSLGKDVYTDKMYADLTNFVSLLKDVKMSDPTLMREKYIAQGLTGEVLEQAIKDQTDLESDRTREVLQERFSSMLTTLDKHVANVAKQHTDLGSRMNRLEMIDNRLKEDELSYTKLLSENEDVDVMEAIMLLNAAESVYQASLQIGAKIMQTTLADYIR